MKKNTTWISRFIFGRGKGWPFVGILFFLLPTIILGAFASIKIYNDTTDYIIAEKKATAFLAASMMKERLDKIVATAVAVASRPRLIEAADKEDWTGALEVIKGIPGAFPYTDAMFLTDEKGTLTEGTPGFRDIIGKNYAFRDWYKGVSKDGEPYVSEAYRRANEPRHNIVAVAVPIKISLYNGDPEKLSKTRFGQDILGILVFQIRLEVFSNWARDVNAGPGGFVSIIDQGDRLIHHPRYDPQGEIVDLSIISEADKIHTDGEGCEVLFDPISKTKMLTAYRKVPGYGWGVIVSQPVRQAFAKRDQALKLTLLVYGVAIALTLGLLFALRSALNERMKVEEGLEKLNKELESFSYSVAHDLRAPLRSMDGFCEVLSKDHADKLDDTAKKCLDRVRSAAGEMGGLIDDLLELSRVSHTGMDLTLVDLSAMAGMVAAGFKQQTPERQVEFSIEQGLVVLGDSHLLEIVLRNMLDNAWKFSGKRPSAKIEFGRRSFAGGMDTFFVRDNGAGFDPRYYEKLFNPFQRLHSEKEFSGTGIGLVIVKRIIERHGGRVWAESEIGKGATFYFTIPEKGGRT